jgi:hypothetical protein
MPMKTAFSIVLISLWHLVSATGLEMRIVYEEPREVSGISASLKEDGKGSSLGIFGKAEAKDGGKRFEGKDVLLVTMPREGRKVGVSVSEEVTGTGPPGFLRLERAERVSRIDCFGTEAGMVIYLHADSGIRKITVRRDRPSFVEAIAKEEVPEMESPMLLSFAKGAKMPLIR